MLSCLPLAPPQARDLVWDPAENPNWTKDEPGAENQPEPKKKRASARPTERPHPLGGLVADNPMGGMGWGGLSVFRWRVDSVDGVDGSDPKGKLTKISGFY